MEEAAEPLESFKTFDQVRCITLVFVSGLWHQRLAHVCDARTAQPRPPDCDRLSTGHDGLQLLVRATAVLLPQAETECPADRHNHGRAGLAGGREAHVLRDSAGRRSDRAGQAGPAQSKQTADAQAPAPHCFRPPRLLRARWHRRLRHCTALSPCRCLVDPTRRVSTLGRQSALQPPPPSHSSNEPRRFATRWLTCFAGRSRPCPTATASSTACSTSPRATTTGLHARRPAGPFLSRDAEAHGSVHLCVCCRFHTPAKLAFRCAPMPAVPGGGGLR